MKIPRVSAVAAIAVVVIAIAVAGLGDRLRLSLTHGATSALVVTNAADTGPGSLREAILAADRSPERTRIVISVSPIQLESALPPLANPRGVLVECRDGPGASAAKTAAPATLTPCVLQPAAEFQGSLLRLDGSHSVVRGITVKGAKDAGVLVTAEDVELDHVEFDDCKDGILIGPGGDGLTIRNGRFERNDTGIRLEGMVRHLTIAHNSFTNNRSAGLWLVGAADSAPEAGSTTSITDNLFQGNGNGVVLANHAALLEHNRFVDTQKVAVLLLGGAATIRANHLQNSAGTGISVTAGREVVISDNEVVDAPGIAIMLRSSSALVERNTLYGNAYGIVSLMGATTGSPVFDGNLIFSNATDGLTIIGGSPRLTHNRLMHNRAAGLRIFDLQEPSGRHNASPVLDGNVVAANGLDVPPVAVYRLGGNPP
jgi:nitrous oxidase accessory protein NosD